MGVGDASTTAASGLGTDASAGGSPGLGVPGVPLWLCRQTDGEAPKSQRRPSLHWDALKHSSPSPLRELSHPNPIVPNARARSMNRMEDRIA